MSVAPYDDPRDRAYDDAKRWQRAMSQAELLLAEDRRRHRAVAAAVDDVWRRWYPVDKNGDPLLDDDGRRSQIPRPNDWGALGLVWNVTVDGAPAGCFTADEVGNLARLHSALCKREPFEQRDEALIDQVRGSYSDRPMLDG